MPTQIQQTDNRCILYDHYGNPMSSGGADSWNRAASSSGSSFSDLGRMVNDVVGPGSYGQRERWSDRECVERLDHWVFVSVQAIRDAVSKATLRCYGPDDTEIDATQDELARILCDVNPVDTRSDLWSITMTFLELCGNSIWLKARDAFGVRELWPLPAHRMRPYRPNGSGIPVGYEMDGLNEPIPFEDVVHIKYPNPHDRFWGMGTLQYAANASRAYDKIYASRLAAFNNEILSSIYFYLDETLPEPQYHRARQMLIERYTSPEKARTPLILENGTKVGNLNPKPAEMDYPNSANMTRDEILAIFGVMPIYAGIVGNANRSNSDTQDRIFLGNTIYSRLIRIQERLNKDKELAPEGRRWAFDDPTPKNKVEEATIRSKDLTSGATAANDVRPAMGLEETTWGTYPKWVWDLMLKHGLTELSEKSVAELITAKEERAEELAAQLASGSQQQTGGDNKEGEEDDDGNQRIVRPNQRMFTGQRIVRSADIEAVTNQARTDQEQIEKQAARAMRRYFSRQLDRVLENVRRLYDHLPQRAAVGQVNRQIFLTLAGEDAVRLYPDGSLVRELAGLTAGVGRIGESVVPSGCLHSSIETGVVSVRAIDPAMADQLDNWGEASEELAALMKEYFEAAMKAGADLQAASLEIAGTFTMRNPYAEQFMQGKIRDYWQGTVSATTKSLLSEKLGEVLAKGATIDELEEAVKFVFGGETKGKAGGGKYGKGRFASARTIARTETIGAYNGGADIQRTEAGVMQKEWVATFDDFTRATHFAADGQRVTQGGTYTVGGAQLRYPGDPAGPVQEIVNCRCFSIAHIPADGKTTNKPGA